MNGRNGTPLASLPLGLRPDAFADVLGDRFLVLLGVAPPPPLRELWSIDGAPTREDNGGIRAHLPRFDEMLVFPLQPALPHEGEALTLGRLETNDIVLHHESVSKFHARIRADDAGRFGVLEDAGSRHGTIVDGTRLPPGATYRLRVGQNVRLGQLSFAYLDAAGLLAVANSPLARELAPAV